MPARKRILFILITWCFLLVFAEASLQVFYRVSIGRWLWEWWAIPIYDTDPVRVYKLKPNLDFTHRTREFTARYRTDALGMRTDEPGRVLSVPKPRDVFRILSLGPSFAFGWGVNYEDSYVCRVSKGLKIPGKHVELLNLGTPSQPQSYQLRWLSQTGYRYEPDLIIQTVYGAIPGLDTDDQLPDHPFRVKNGYLEPEGKLTFSLWVRKTRRYSALLFYGWHFYQEILRPEKAPAGDGREFYRKVDSTQDSVASNTVREYTHYTRFVHGVLTNKPPIVFLYIPPMYVVRPADLGRVAHHGSTIDPFEERKKSALLAGALRSNAVELIDLTSALLEKDKAARMYNLYDLHFTVEGNRAVADCVLPIIQHWLDQASAGDH
jgi:hypothetical protein